MQSDEIWDRLCISGLHNHEDIVTYTLLENKLLSRSYSIHMGD